MKSQHSKLTPAGIQTRNLSITNPALLPTSYHGYNIYNNNNYYYYYDDDGYYY